MNTCITKTTKINCKLVTNEHHPLSANISYRNDKNINTLIDPENVLDGRIDYGANLFGKSINDRLLLTHDPENEESSPLLAEVERAVGTGNAEM